MHVTKEYNHKEIEKKWQKKWFSSKIYSPDLDRSEKPFYNLFMFPYPSAEGMHTGHAMSSTGSDIYGRFMRMQGRDVFQPMGFDSFGIHAENYAIKTNQTPQEMLSKTIKHFGDQFKSFGHGYDWTRILVTSDVDYYRWTQWIFLEFFKAGLAYRRKAILNFCPKDKTVLADEQVMTPKQAGKEPVDLDGNPVEDREGLMVCERCGTVVEKKELEVWFFRITDYADKLLKNLEKIDWSSRVVKAQREWIGRSEGRLIDFEIENSTEKIAVFTTKPETLNSASFIAEADADLYEKHGKDKVGNFTGRYAINPLNGRRLPIWKASYVAPYYGTGAVMGVPAYDERDAAFAKAYNIEILREKPEKNDVGKKHISYHLRDWGIGRQRYWGCPIPMIYCKSCAERNEGYFSYNIALIHNDQSDWNWYGWWPEENLPVVIPAIKDYKPEGGGRGPLANHPEFYEVKCPHCGADARRETDVADTFLDSSWYFFRYPSTEEKDRAWRDDRTKKWLPVDLYFGGAEHAVLHLMYARFTTMVFKDLKLIDFDEPFPKFYAHGLMIKDGAKMSKSRGNVVNPDEYIKKFGADTLRMYLVFIGPMDGYPDFRDTGIEGMHRFVKRVWSLYTSPDKNLTLRENSSEAASSDSSDQDIITVTNKTVKKVTEDIKIFHYNTALSAIMEFVNYLKAHGSTKEALKTLCQLIAPFAPHLAEEVWVEILGQKYSVHTSRWPEYDPGYLEEDFVTIIVQVDGKSRSQIKVDKAHSSDKKKLKDLALSDEKIQKWVNGGVTKTIFVPGKIINFVTRGRGTSRNSGLTT